MKAYSPDAKNGFTLIELLVVVSIIALLVSILMPALGRARQQAQSVVCQANLKQIALGSMMFADEHDGYGPPAVFHVDSTMLEEGGILEHDKTLNVDNTIAGYLSIDGNRDIFNCPADKKSLIPSFSYGQNGHLVHDQMNPSMRWGPENIWYYEHGRTKLSTIKSASEVAWYMDCTYVGEDEKTACSWLAAEFYLSDAKESNSPGNFAKDYLSRIHPGKSNPSYDYKEDVHDPIPNAIANVAWMDGRVTPEVKDFRSRLHPFKYQNFMYYLRNAWVD